MPGEIDQENPRRIEARRDSSVGSSSDSASGDATNEDGLAERGFKSRLTRAIEGSSARAKQSRNKRRADVVPSPSRKQDGTDDIGDSTRRDLLILSGSPYAGGEELPVQYQQPQYASNKLAPNTGAETEAVSFADFALILRRNLRLIVLLVLALTILSGLALAMATPRYTASADILLGSSVTANRGTENFVSSFGDDEASIQSQVSLLESSDLALRVIDEIGLHEVAEFAPDGESTSVLQRIVEQVGIAGLSGSEPAISSLSRGAGANGTISVAAMQVLRKFSKWLSIEHVPGTRVVTVSFTASDPVLASTAANSMAEAYIDDQRALKFTAVNETADWLTTRVSELRSSVSASEIEIENYKLKAGITDEDGMTLSDRELSTLNAQLIESRARSMEAQTRLNEIRSLLTTPNGIDSAAEVLNSSLIQRLREQESTLMANVAELGAELGDKHPRLLQMQAEVNQVRQKIDLETAKIVNALEYEYNIAKSRERAITSSLESTTGQLEVSVDDVVQLNSLQRDVAADRLLLETLLAQLKQVGNQLDLSSQQADALIISRALSPLEPSFPKFGPMLSLAAIGSLLLAFMIAMIREFGDRTIRSEQQVVRRVGIMPLGVIPQTTRRQRRGRTLFEYAVKEPNSHYAMSARAVAERVRIGASANGGGKTIITTSAMHGDGKSALALALANALSSKGRTVLLVDADFFSPQLHDDMNITPNPGLIDVLEQNVSISDAVYAANTAKPFVFMPVGDVTVLPDGGLDFEVLEETLAAVENHFDNIIVNAPPLLTSDDALSLARIADATVVSMRWGKTHFRVVKSCAEKLAQRGCRNIGGVLTDVNMRKYELYEYGQTLRPREAAAGLYAR